MEIYETFKKKQTARSRADLLEPATNSQSRISYQAASGSVVLSVSSRFLGYCWLGPQGMGGSDLPWGAGEPKDTSQLDEIKKQRPEGD